MRLCRPPYKAANMVDLINKIKNRPLSIPRETNNISKATEDVLRKMLVVKPSERIEWEQLFKHPILSYLDEKIQKDMEQTMKESEDISMNMSKFYIKTNMVVEHPTEIQKRQGVNDYAYNVINSHESKGVAKESLNIKREQGRDSSKDKPSNRAEIKTEQIDTDTAIGVEETLRETQIRAFKKNAKCLLHHRNIYVFLASVAE